MLIGVIASAPPAATSPTFGDLTDCQAVGLGMYLGLGIIQVVSSGGMATLRRKHSALEQAVKANKLRNEASEIRSIAGELSRLEIGTDSFHSSTLWLVSVLFLLALAGFAVTVAVPDVPISKAVLYSTIGGYLAVPVILYGFAMVHLRGKSRNARRKIAAAQKRIAASS